MCCLPTIKSFVNQLQSIIPYTPDLRQHYGRVPDVIVFYHDVLLDKYYISQQQSKVIIDNDFITIDHGGLATGLVAIR